MLTRLTLCLAVIGCLAAALPAPAENGPTFRILQPTATQAIDGQFTISIAFQSLDDTPIVRFDAYIDNVYITDGRISNPIPAGSFQVPCSLSSVNIAPGKHKLQVKLMDSAGRVTQREQTVTVGGISTERTAPTVSITAPKEGVGITGPAKVRIEAGDDSGIKWVMLYIDGQLRMMMNEAPYEVMWDPIKDKLSLGAHTLQARAFDAFDNEGISEQVIVKVVRPMGLTPIETTVPTSSQPALGIFEVSDLYQPTGGPLIPRQAFSNVISPITDWLVSLTRPAPVMFAAERRYRMPMAEAGLTALLPPKSLPGLPAAGAIEGRGLPPAPVLAWASYRLPSPSMNSRPATASPLLPTLAPVAGREEVEAERMIFNAVLPEKGWPEISEAAIYAVPETKEAAEPSSPALPAAAGDEPAEEPFLVALVPGAMMQLTPQRSSVEVTAQPVARRMLPDKSAPAHYTELAAAPAVTTIDPIAPSHGAELSRPADGVAAPRPDVTISSPSLSAADGGARPVPQSPTAGGSLPAKVSPSPVMMAALPATAFTPNPDEHAARPTLAEVASVHAQPAPAAVMELHGPYTVRDDDTLEKIARAFATTPDELIKLNPNISPEHPLPVNATLVVPRTDARIYIDETPLLGAVEPFISNDYTMVPMRAVVEAKDGIVIWLPKTREVNAWAANTFMNVKIGRREAMINNEPYLLPVAPSLKQSRTMVPLRYLMSAMNLQVEYNVASGTYYLVSR